MNARDTASVRDLSRAICKAPKPFRIGHQRGQYCAKRRGVGNVDDCARSGQPFGDGSLVFREHERQGRETEATALPAGGSSGADCDVCANHQWCEIAYVNVQMEAWVVDRQALESGATRCLLAEDDVDDDVGQSIQYLAGGGFRTCVDIGCAERYEYATDLSWLLAARSHVRSRR